MTRRALLAILALIAGFVVLGPGPSAPAEAVAASATVDAAHLLGAATRGTTAAQHPVQVDLGQPLDGVQPAVHVPPAPPVPADVVDPTHRLPERNGRSPLGGRAPPPTPGS
ncbi:hypothetical protein [Saccharothrix sp. HUAS TT1]|uniref:hypothetical protein n=1 Tax=unclassified Saccharothrix TaxID=2593673 RepID=UPI00345B77D6